MVTTVLLVGAVAASLLWAGGITHSPVPEAEAYLRSTDKVTVLTLGEWLTFQPAEEPPTVGFIFYPGGNVDYKAYAPALFGIAERGYLVVDVPMPMNLAILGYQRAGDVIAAHPEIEHWVVGGHSLGGAMAARFAFENPGAVEGVVLWAAYPAESNDLSEMDVRVLSVYGTLDGVTTPDEISASATFLPADTTWVAIEGGNHGQFGYYGNQDGDNPAKIDREEQTAQIVEATADFLAQFSE